MRNLHDHHDLYTPEEHRGDQCNGSSDNHEPCAISKVMPPHHVRSCDSPLPGHEGCMRVKETKTNKPQNNHSKTVHQN